MVIHKHSKIRIINSQDKTNKKINTFNNLNHLDQIHNQNQHIKQYNKELSY